MFDKVALSAMILYLAMLLSCAQSSVAIGADGISKHVGAEKLSKSGNEDCSSFSWLESKRPVEEDEKAILAMLDKCPNNGDAWIAAGELCVRLGLWDEASEKFNHADTVAPGAFLSEYHRLLRRSEESARKLDFYAFTDEPVDSAVLYRVGRVELEKGFIRESRQTLESAAALATPWPGTNACLGRVYLHEREYRKALEQAAKELQRNPSDLEASRVRTISMQSLGRI